MFSFCSQEEPTICTRKRLRWRLGDVSEICAQRTKIEYFITQWHIPVPNTVYIDDPFRISFILKLFGKRNNIHCNAIGYDFFGRVYLTIHMLQLYNDTIHTEYTMCIL